MHGSEFGCALTINLAISAASFRNRASEITSVAYSPDGKYIASGSRDGTSAENGMLISGPSTGHLGLIFSVASSPSGRHIVSGSGSGNVGVWDTMSGEFVAGPFRGPLRLGSVCCILAHWHAYVSGSSDRTMYSMRMRFQHQISTQLGSYLD